MEVAEIINQAIMTGGDLCNHVDNIAIDSCYFLAFQLNINGTCSNITDLTNKQFFCDEHDNTKHISRFVFLAGVHDSS